MILQVAVAMMHQNPPSISVQRSSLGDRWSFKTALCDTRIHLGRDWPLGIRSKLVNFFGGLDSHVYENLKFSKKKKDRNWRLK